jgi:hypothetical protein
VEAREAALEMGSLTELNSQAAVRALARLNAAANALVGLTSGASLQPNR